MPAAPPDQTLSLDRYSAEAKRVVAAAQRLADEQRHAEVDPLHVLLQLVAISNVADVIRRAGADPHELFLTAEAALRRLPLSTSGVAYVSAALLALLRRAEREADRESAPATDLAHLLLAVSQEIRGVTRDVLGPFHILPGAFRPHVGALRPSPDDPATAPASGALSPTRDLLAAARDGDPVIGRDGEIRRVLQILERRGKHHPLLVGEAGVGVSAVLRGLALRIAAGDVPTNLRGARLRELDAGALLAGVKLRGEIEERLRRLTYELVHDVTAAAPLLVVEGLADLLGQGSLGAGVGDVLRSLLARHDVHVLATTTPEGARRLHDRDSALLRRFSVVTIEAPTLPQAEAIVRGVLPRYERHHEVRIGEDAVLATVRLAARYVRERVLPDSALDLLDETAAQKRLDADGVPVAVDAALRRVESLTAQRLGLDGKDDRASREQRQRIDDELATLTPTVSAAQRDLDARRGALAAETALRGEIAGLEEALAAAKGAGDEPRAGEIAYVTLPPLRRRLADATAAVAHARGGQPDDRTVTAEDVARTLEAWTGIATQRMLEGESEKLLRMEARLRERVVGQDEAVSALARAVRRSRVGLRDPGKPIGSFLFLGPSGVGKTELAKALAALLFDDEQALTRLDMSEFMERHMAQRLLGAPPGYADSEQGGFLTEAVRRRPYSVLLFDEVEKAHPDVFNLLLQVLDDGRLTDGRGRVADFSNTVIVMTSNVGSGRILAMPEDGFATDEGREEIRGRLFDELKGFFRPEFLNRIDDVVIFRSLPKEALRGIVDLQLRALERLLAPRRLTLQLSEAAKTLLVERSYEPAFGARPLRRTIVKELQDPLAEAILTSGYGEGTVVHVDAGPGGLVFATAKTTA